MVDCAYCGTVTNNKKYCSEACQHSGYRKTERDAGNRVELKCAMCDCAFEVHKSDLKIHPNKRYCSRTCKDTHQKSLYLGKGNPLSGRTVTPEQMELRKRRRMVNSAKRRAKEKNIPFDITPFDFQIPSNCPLLGIPLLVNKGVVSGNSPSLDRINPEKGYIKGNIQVISYRANSIKQDATLQELTHLVQQLTPIWEKSN